MWKTHSCCSCKVFDVKECECEPQVGGKHSILPIDVSQSIVDLKLEVEGKETKQCTYIQKSCFAIYGLPTTDVVTTMTTTTRTKKDNDGNYFHLQ